MSSSLRPSTHAPLILKVLLWVLHRFVFAWTGISSNLVRTKDFVLSLWPKSWASPTRKNRGKLPAAPAVIAIVLAEAPNPQDCLDEVASLTWWSAELGLSTIQVFEPTGALKQAAAALSQRLNFARGASIFDVKAGFGDTKPLKAREGWTESAPSGQARDCTKVILLSSYDAEAPLFASARWQSESVPTAQASMRSMRTTEDFYKRLAESSGPDAVLEPNLILVFGPVLMLAGFPSWLARNSEIYHAGRLAAASRAVIVKCLQKYRKTSQRFGT